MDCSYSRTTAISLKYSLGIDIGTSGIRAAILNEQQNVIAQSYIASQSTIPQLWWRSFEQLIFKLKQELEQELDLSHRLKLSCISHLAIAGTSATVLLIDKTGEPCTETLMYNDLRAINYAQIIDQYAPINSASTGASSSLSKLLWLFNHHKTHHLRDKQQLNSIAHIVTQTDWLNGKLSQCFAFSDYNNALKMGYDAQLKCWPTWLITFLDQQNIPRDILPNVISPGKTITTIDKKVAQYFGFSSQLKICAGTTDSTAAIIASGAKDYGVGITSLGSSLVMKIISDKAIFDTQSGVYSQPYGNLWLVGGASNSGGAVLKHYFSNQEIQQYSHNLYKQFAQKQCKLLNLNYYPLLTPGERFPIQDPHLEAKLLPRTKNKMDFFQALLEGMADIETLAYQGLLELGMPYPKHVISIGGGALNQAWTNIRQNKLGVPIKMATHQQAAVGSAILAQSSW